MATKQYLDEVGLQRLWERICEQDRDLLNKITINANDIAELKQQIGEPMVRYNTVDGWNSQPQLLSEKGVIYIYLDRNVNNTIVPGFKVGNGAYLIDIQFVDSLYILHMQDNIIHITQQEREKWNNKVDIDVNQQAETLIITK